MNVSQLKVASQTDACKKLLRDFSSGEASHAYYFHTEDVLLSKCIAYVVAMADGGEIDLTSPRSKRIGTDKCADVKFFGAGTLNADVANNLVADCYVAPSELNRKYYVIDFTGVNASSQEVVQNKLLKILEEPPRDVTFFIISANVADILPTVKSRLEVVAPALSVTCDLGVDDFSPYYDIALYAGRGSLTETAFLLSGEGGSLFNTALRFVKLAASGNKLGAVSVLPTRRAEYAKILGYVEYILGDVMKVACGLEVDTRGLYDAKKTAEVFGKNNLPRMLSAVRRAVRRAPSGNLTSVSDTLILQITEV